MEKTSILYCYKVTATSKQLADAKGRKVCASEAAFKLWLDEKNVGWGFFSQSPSFTSNAKHSSENRSTSIQIKFDFCGSAQSFQGLIWAAQVFDKQTKNLN